MTGNNAAIDIEYTEVSPARETPTKVVEARERFAEGSRNTRETAPETTEALAKALGVSEPTIRKWMRRFSEVVPASMLSASRGQWQPLAVEMASDYHDHRQTLTMDQWLETRSGIYAPEPKAVAEAFVFDAERQGAIVPAALTDAAEARSLALTQAQSLQGFAGALLEQVGRHLAANSATATEEQAAIADAAIVASEMAAIIREQQLRAKVRADFEAQQSAATAATLEQKLSDLRGAS